VGEPIADAALDGVIEARAARDTDLFASGGADGAVAEVEVSQPAQEAAGGLFTELVGVLSDHGWFLVVGG
jgi:ABC-type nitrate/sulfonate/bicarbonate transport system substrate-binding protein